MALGAQITLITMALTGPIRAQEDRRPGLAPDAGLALFQQAMAQDDRAARMAWLEDRIDAGRDDPALIERLVRGHESLRWLAADDRDEAQDALFLKAAMDPDPLLGQPAIEAARSGTAPPIRRSQDLAAVRSYAEQFLWVRHYSYVDHQMSYFPSVGAYAVFLDLPDVTIRGWDVWRGDGEDVRSQEFARLSEDLAFLEGLQASQQRARRVGWPLVGGGVALLGGSVPGLVAGIDRGDEGPLILGTALLCAGVGLATAGARVLVQDGIRQREVGYSKLISADHAGDFIEAYDHDLAESLGLDPWDVLGLEHEAVREAVLGDQSE